MGYYFSTELKNITFEEAISKTKEALKEEGFGVLTEIDMKTTLKQKLDVDILSYKILGACNPSMAYQALQAENKIGTMLPCNVIVQEIKEGNIEIAAVDPAASMQAIKNDDLVLIAKKVRAKLEQVIQNLNNV
ncbi:DUF302 domain-containing protein [Maribacter flavus]|uniref:DUF302 domain-containing protein n=1 Tax=Maribacter flavus TaxID=1658664 RepID=A0A5B2U186_9FLAO|nr:DUF302 domain-containing protein [Maribacter flavus]KAA2219800.1 DUF302 domain-containing protein [Maribacter flavus]